MVGSVATTVRNRNNNDRSTRREHQKRGAILNVAVDNGQEDLYACPAISAVVVRSGEILQINQLMTGYAKSVRDRRRIGDAVCNYIEEHVV